jgi:cell division septal protein FtsQ
MTSSATEIFEKEIQLEDRKAKPLKWLTIAASVVVFAGVGIYTFTTITNTEPASELGTFNDPQVAYDETQKALSLLSNQVNTGIECVRYVETYEVTRDKIFILE